MYLVVRITRIQGGPEPLHALIYTGSVQHEVEKFVAELNKLAGKHDAYETWTAQSPGDRHLLDQELAALRGDAE